MSPQRTGERLDALEYILFHTRCAQNKTTGLEDRVRYLEAAVRSLGDTHNDVEDLETRILLPMGLLEANIEEIDQEMQKLNGEIARLEITLGHMRDQVDALSGALPS
ncbi:hypothetical protein OPT61_g1318 [Boeremia exigua]|uniref:Uncharacterized protein n=1 Tax=Boeremia exigua TaxID=749465 RepID=A0ACC2IQJ3_9PLEO|nr:hypothetical protein OPT61_g1318 [Boeremia exigua]